jgi:hypothetical protein
VTHVRLTRKGVVRTALLLGDVFEGGDADRPEWWEKDEEAVELIDLVLRYVDGVIQEWDPTAPGDDTPAAG